MNEKITIMIADDHPLIREGLRKAIENDERLTVVSDVADGKKAVAAAAEFAPDVIVLDIDMPEMNGFDAARAIRNEGLSGEIVFLTMHRDEDLFNEAIDLGAKGFVLKDSALTDIVDCIKAVASKNHFVSHALTRFLIDRGRRAASLAESQPTINDLTPTERRLLRMIAEGLTTKEIGEQLFISPRTVEKHRQNICQKLDLHGSHSLFKFAVQNRSKLL